MSTSPWYRNPELTQRVADLTRQGLSAPVIAAMLGVNTRTVQRHRSQAGVCQPRTIPLTDDERRRALELLEDGASIAEAARTLGRSHTPMLRSRRYSAYKWTRQQVAESAVMGRAMAQLERKVAS